VRRFPGERWIGEGGDPGEDFSEVPRNAVEQLVAPPRYPGWRGNLLPVTQHFRKRAGCDISEFRNAGDGANELMTLDRVPC
jgi:hypothetical protein